MLTTQEVQSFQTIVLDYYHANQRDLLWRHVGSDDQLDPYKVMVSEVMLQQTQVPRVTEKYQQFLQLFPTVHDLAAASLHEVLFVWQGLGYNRRARFLREAAIIVVRDHDGAMPQTLSELVALPGIGPNTASAILVYSYNQPLSFIETNIRTVYIHHFFADSEAVKDKQILELVAQTIYMESPRDWYWALMDYGTYVKTQVVNPSRRSKHYAKQSRFEGSVRQLRGEILRRLSSGPQVESTLAADLNDERFNTVVDSLIQDHLLARIGKKLRIAD